MMSDMNRGRIQFLGVVGAMLLEVLLLSLSVWLRGGELHPVSDVGRPLVFAGLAASLSGAQCASSL